VDAPAQRNVIGARRRAFASGASSVTLLLPVVRHGHRVPMRAVDTGTMPLRSSPVLEFEGVSLRRGETWRVDARPGHAIGDRR